MIENLESTVEGLVKSTARLETSISSLEKSNARLVKSVASLEKTSQKAEDKFEILLEVLEEKGLDLSNNEILKGK